MRCAVLTVSTTVARREREDVSGPALARLADAAGCDVVALEVVSDDGGLIEDRLRHWVDEGVPLVFTTGGTGFTPDDCTPEAALCVIERRATGLEAALHAEARARHPMGALSRAVADGLNKSGHFHVIDTLQGQPVTMASLESALRSGDYRTGIRIPKGAYAEMVNSANGAVNQLAGQLGLPALPNRAAKPDMYVRLYFDPATKPAMRTAISFGLDKCITAASSSVLLDRFAALSPAADGASRQKPDSAIQAVFAGIGLKEEALGRAISARPTINSVQHNVPAWAIFGMFFIVVPMAGYLIRERDEGSALRVALAPHSAWPVIAGKVLFYTLVCTVQFVLMCCIGLWVIPLMGLPRLALGPNWWALIPVVPAIGLVATSYGMFVGTVFRTTSQAMPFGAISIVILAALGGIWVPVDLLPRSVQIAAWISPLHWSHEGVNAVLLRGGGLTAVLPMVGALVALSAVLLGVAYAKGRRVGL